MRVLVIGLDGASPQLIERWMDELPTIRKFKEGGCLGLSTPPVPAQTPVAWTSFMTGKNPGKHGIFSYAQRRMGTYERRIMRPELVGSKTLWQILSEHGKRVGVINVPMSTYKGVHGFMIPGFLDREEGIIQPKEVLGKFKRRFADIKRVRGDVETEALQRVEIDPDFFIQRVFEVTEELGEVSLYLMEEEKWDFCMTVFMGADRLQHFLWRYVDESHPRYEDSEYGLRVKEYYKKIDGIIERFLDVTSEDVVTILLSDHGFCPIHKELIINNYLQELGVLRVKDGKVDLEGSKAVSYGYGDVWLNLRGREPSGIVERGEKREETIEQIIDYLENLKVDEEKPIKKVERREKIYWGPYVDEAPDLTIFFNPGWQAARTPEVQATRGIDKRYVVDDPRWSGGHDGTHDPIDVPGILGFLGQGIECRREIRAPLWDLTSTILSLMRVQIPADMDGKPLLITPGEDAP
ncbi:MAG: alkaline phosphatase family protein [Candidatus Geothermarchaeales archaeon]